MSEPLISAARFLTDFHAEQITLHDLADHVGYSPFHLSRRFAEFVGVSPVQYLAARRFQRAKTLLVTTDASVLEICHEVGFTSIGTFSRRFAAEVGVSPTEFRRLPDVVADRGVRPGQPGSRVHGGGVIRGRVRYRPDIAPAIGPRAATYVGLFEQRAPRGLPLIGALVHGEAEFELVDVQPGRYFLLCNSRPHPDDPLAQVLPSTAYVGGHPSPIDVAPGGFVQVAVTLHEAFAWATPITAALPALALAPAPGYRSSQAANASKE
ncbi:helix-turn-helix domain-containing protein [Epidermidibacterium keratini]|uniref:Helix-turn-helix domain-containing protein n=1 Tax=Epidermidibacterium keratini TaxID=1891644 RepID=A0A7L4YP19_9ACTN|nr:helix-turn-helix transcriptional regulator [Epidermidibacterium keratini]QHC00307.1 helix-turn-helix domain-containing protein [Epidermidibacterium keratini]